jgi:hypothetical protein
MSAAGNRSEKRAKSNDDKWLANLSKVMTFIADKERNPSQKSSDAGERKLACWIALSKKKRTRAADEEGHSKHLCPRQ